MFSSILNLRAFSIAAGLFCLGNNILSANTAFLPVQEQTAVWTPKAQIASCRKYLQEHSENHFITLQEYDVLTTYWLQYHKETNGLFNLSLVLEAVKFSARKHEGQYRDGGAPYIVHPLGVCQILWEKGGIRSANVLIASLLHDTIEDTETTSEEVEQLFGKRVRITVEEVTNDPNLSSKENKQRQVDHAPYMSLDAQLVKIADRLYNLNCLKEAPPENWSPEDINNYFAWGQKLLNALSGCNADLENALQSLIDDYKSKTN